MKLIWQPQAEEDRVSIYDFIDADRPQAAVDVDDRILEAISSLERFPFRGRPGKIRGTRELVISDTRYVVAYALRDEEILILRILDGARRWPRKMTRH